MPQWISQPIIIMKFCHREETKSCSQGNPPRRIWMWQPGGGSLAVTGNRSCCWDVGNLVVLFLWWQLSPFLPKSRCPALRGGCSQLQPWSPTRPWLWRGAQDSAEAFCACYSLLSVLPLQFFIAFHSLLPEAFGRLVCSTKNTPRIEVCLIILWHFAFFSLHPLSIPLHTQL